MTKKIVLLISLMGCMIFAGAFMLTGCGTGNDNGTGESTAESVEPAEPEGVQITAEDNKPYNCIETSDSVICCDLSSIYKYDKKTDAVERVLQDEGELDFMKVNDGTIIYSAHSGNGIANNGRIYSLDPNTCESTLLTDDAGGGYFDVVDGMIYYLQYVDGEDVEPPYTVQMKPDGSDKEKSSEYEIGEPDYTFTGNSNSEDYRVENDTADETTEMYGDYKLYTPTGIKTLNFDNPIAYFLSVNEIGNDFASIDKKYNIKGNGGSVTDALHKYTTDKNSFEFLFVATIPTDTDWDYKIADTDKCIGMYGTAKDLLGIEKDMSMKDFCTKADLFGYTSGSGVGLESAGYTGVWFDVTVNDDTNCVMLLRDVNDTITPETMVYVDKYPGE